jgi:hypothetical protein
MSVESERQGLIARITQIRRRPVAAERAPAKSDLPPGRVRDLETRCEHLEHLIAGLQDSMYRESQRLSGRITELEARTDPAAVAAALSQHARKRGL